jgi:hypothetical protein
MGEMVHAKVQFDSISSFCSWGVEAVHSSIRNDEVELWDCLII